MGIPIAKPSLLLDRPESAKLLKSTERVDPEELSARVEMEFDAEDSFEEVDETVRMLEAEADERSALTPIPVGCASVEIATVLIMYCVVVVSVLVFVSTAVTVAGVKVRVEVTMTTIVSLSRARRINMANGENENTVFLMRRPFKYLIGLFQSWNSLGANCMQQI